MKRWGRRYRLRSDGESRGGASDQSRESIAAYAKTSGVSGNINSVGSDSLNNLMTLWAETFRKMYPNVKIQVEGKGSSTAPAALISGTAQFGPMSRAMRSTEIDQFEKKYGYKPPDPHGLRAPRLREQGQPIEKLELEQVDAALKEPPRGGKPSEMGQLGLTGDWANAPSASTAQLRSGTYASSGSTSSERRLQGLVKSSGSASVVQGVTEDRFGMGYSGIGYKTSGVKAVPLAEKAGGHYSSGSYEDVKTDKYPLHRFLFIYINKAPGKPLDPVVREFVKLIMSKEGQEVVVKDGYLPLPEAIVKQELAKVE